MTDRFVVAKIIAVSKRSSLAIHGAKEIVGDCDEIVQFAGIDIDLQAPESVVGLHRLFVHGCLLLRLRIYDRRYSVSFWA